MKQIIFYVDDETKEKFTEFKYYLKSRHISLKAISSKMLFEMMDNVIKNGYKDYLGG
jgi:hypothetical protein